MSERGEFERKLFNILVRERSCEFILDKKYTLWIKPESFVFQEVPFLYKDVKPSKLTLARLSLILKCSYFLMSI
jgi:hypothetical protein